MEVKIIRESSSMTPSYSEYHSHDTGKNIAEYMPSERADGSIPK